jgi:Arabinose efflux permease
MTKKNKNGKFGLIIAVYLLGIFMGAIDTGIVTPARTVIQNYLSVDSNTGIWMITMYTLAYAASIPVMGKLADKFGRKTIYLISISLFGIGSLFCGLSQDFQSFTVLLIARAVQAIGGGGIVPIANAEFGTSFPKEKRGMALGLIGGVYGLANILGSSAGSAILDLFGTDNWQFIFYINVPITIFIIIAGSYALTNSKEEQVKKIDYFGIAILVAMILSLLYGLKNIDFFNFTKTIQSLDVYPFLIAFVVLLPFFIFAENKADDPVMNLEYFKKFSIIITLILSFITGVILMGMIFVPQFSENALKIASGKGGYFVLILGLFSGISAPISGKLIDKYGVKIVLGLGFLFSGAGSLYLILITANYPNLFNVIFSLVLVGVGIGFTMGTPINYMMLENTKKEEATSALATVSLVRSIGTAIAPAIMIGFISHAGASIQGNVMNLLPNEIKVPELPYVQELTESLDKLKADPTMKDKLANVKIPDLASMQTVKFNMNATDSNIKIPKETLELMRTADVTTITPDIKTLSSVIFDQMTPKIVTNIQDGVQDGIDSLETNVSGLDRGIGAVEASIAKQSKPNPALEGQLKGMQAAKASMTDTINKMNILNDAVPKAFETAKKNYLAEIDQLNSKIETEFQDTLDGGFKQVYMTVTISSILGLLLLVLYRRKKSYEYIDGNNEEFDAL